MARGYIAVEGQGEVRAIHNLVVRLWYDLGLSPTVWADPPLRVPAIQSRAGLLKMTEYVRRLDAEMLLVVRDADDDSDCPKFKGPEMAAWLAAEALRFPAAVVLIRREYETLFLPSLHRMAGVPLRDERNVERPGLQSGTQYTGDYEARRDVKGWLSEHFPSGRAYKPTLDQLPLTRLINFDDLREAGLPSFGTLERALRFLDARRGQAGIYPPPSS